MAKWARRSGGRRRWRWVIEAKPLTKEVKKIEPDPFTFDTPEAIRAALARLDVRMIEEKERIADG